MRAGSEMKKALTYDAAEFLESDEDIAAYLNAALDDGDPVLVSAALGDIARARGMFDSKIRYHSLSKLE